VKTSTMLRTLESLRVGLLACDVGQVAICGGMAVYAGTHGEPGWGASLAVMSIVGAVLATISYRGRRPAPVSNSITINVTRETTTDTLARELIAAFNAGPRGSA
jgi:hypothetical protein